MAFTLSHPFPLKIVSRWPARPHPAPATPPSQDVDMLIAPADSALIVSSLSRISPPAMSGVLCRECTCRMIFGISPGPAL